MKQISMYGNPVIEEKMEEFILKNIPDYHTRPLEDKRMVINKMIRGCHNCSLYYDTNYDPIPPIINEGSFAIFIGRSPSRVEAKTNELFPKGTSVGAVFDKYLSQLGLARSEVSVLNMANCYTQNNRPPQQECINRCVSYKKFEFPLIGDDYQVIFLMGNDACRWMFGLSPRSSLSTHGEIYIANINGKPRTLIPIIHPSLNDTARI